MNISKSEFESFIKNFKIKELFNYLGWDNDRTIIPAFQIDNTLLAPTVIADKNGFKIIECNVTRIPSYASRIKIANSLKSIFHENMIIFTDGIHEQVWLYCYNINSQCKKVEIHYNTSQDVERLYERASGLIFELDEQDKITIVDVTARVRMNFAINADRVTKRFYTEFKKQHTELLTFISGIEAQLDKEWYASIMLNRLMFCYFMQRRGFLNNDRHYLLTKLNESKEKLGKGKFYSFYRSFLLVLFQKGFGTYSHPTEIKEMLGDIPYLNGGLFDLHELERNYPNIDISDDAFESIFNLFDRYEWHLDTRECASGDEISPDVLGYIFEKYINDRSQMGAYYTKEDITGYISRSAILPYLLESTKRAYPKPFEKHGLVWKFLQESGSTYIFESTKKGIEYVLPDYIAVGVDTIKPNLKERRERWNEPALSEYALPTETWREFIKRTNQCRDVIKKITSGQIVKISDFITFNLDITSFVTDLLDTIEDPKFIQVFYQNLERITILDPTCGSGAFLFAALNILEPLYDSCLSRMDDYLSHDYKGSIERSIKRYFDEKLEMMESEIHPNKHYFIYKSIILNNLYGVDIMKEAVETAKLRLFLKLVSTATPNYYEENIGIEPLPDIDFNIKAGNTFIGYSTEQDVEAALNHDLLARQMIVETKDAMLQMAKAVSRYKQLQLGAGDYKADDFKEAKNELSDRQKKLKSTLDDLLRKWDYSNISETDWNNHYLPFHWVSEFYSIIVENGGFDVIIGNPPYVEYSKTKRQYELIDFKTIDCGNLYAFAIERSCYIIHKNGFFGMIVPLSICCGERMSPLRDLIKKNIFGLHISNFEIFPSKLFDGAFQRLSILIGEMTSKSEYYRTTKLNRWYSIERNDLIDKQRFSKMITNEGLNLFGKYDDGCHYNIVLKIAKGTSNISAYCNKGQHFIYYQEATNYWMKATKRIPYYKKNGTISKPDHGRVLSFSKEKHCEIIHALLNSSTFYLWYITYSDGFHLSDTLVKSFPILPELFDDTILSKLSKELDKDVQKHSYIASRNTKKDRIEIETFKMVLSKPIIDQIDNILARHYGFTEEELDYIINYDIKYRVGSSGDDTDE